MTCRTGSRRPVAVGVLPDVSFLVVLVVLVLRV
jgi:hypothetical protein